jgi:hypothetical protein
MSAAPGVSEALLTCGSVRKTRAKALVNPKRQYLSRPLRGTRPETVVPAQLGLLVLLSPPGRG